MKRQALFSPALFAHFLRRFWPFMAAVAVLLALHAAGLASIVSFASAYTGGGSGADPVRAAAAIQMAAAPWLCASAAPTCLVAALLVFRHLRDRAEMQFYMGMPFSRTCLFLTAHVSALCLVAVPAAAVAVVIAALEVAGGLAALLPGLGMTAVACACALLLFGGLASLSCVATGRAGGAVLAYACLNVAAIALYGASAQALQQVLVGVPLDSGGLLDAVLWLTPTVKLATSAAMPYSVGADGWSPGFNDPAALAVYAVAGAALAVVSWALYRVRPAERTGETMAFAGSRITFQALASLVVASLGTIVASLWGLQRGVDGAAVRYGVCMVVFAAVGWIAAEMVVRRTPRVFDARTLAGCSSLAGALVVAFALMSFDAFGIVRWVPDPSQVERAEVRYGSASGEVDPAAAVAVHRAVLGNRDVLEQREAWYIAHVCKVGYDMADGSHVERSYRLNDFEGAPTGEVWDAARAALDDPDAVYRATFGTDRDLALADIDQVNYELTSDYLGTGRPYEDNWAPFSREDAYGLYRAVTLDIREGNATVFEDELSEERDIGNVTFDLMPGAVDAVEEGASSTGFLAPVPDNASVSDDGSGFHGSLRITARMVHTLDWIREFELRADWQDRSEGAGVAQ